MSVPKFPCERLHISKDGYDRNNRYFGVGAPVYEVESTYLKIFYGWNPQSKDYEPIREEKAQRYNTYRAYSKAEARAKHHARYPSDKAE